MDEGNDESCEIPQTNGTDIYMPAMDEVERAAQPVVRKSSRPRKQSRRMLDSGYDGDDQSLDMPKKKKCRKTSKSKPVKKLVDVLPNGEPFKCSLCGSSSINSCPGRAKKESEPVVKEKDGRTLYLCITCAVAVNLTENKGSTREQRAQFEEEGKHYAQLLAEQLKDTDASRLYCSFYSITKCGCIQNYINGTLVTRKRKSSLSVDCDSSDVVEPTAEEGQGDDKLDQTQRAKYLLSLLKEAKSLKQVRSYKKLKPSEKDRVRVEVAEQIKNFEKFILANRVKLRDLGICARGCQRVLCYSNNFLHKKHVGSEPRIQRTKGRAALGQLPEIHNIAKLKCCARSCIEMVEKNQQQVSEWRQRSLQKQKDACIVISEMLFPKDVAKPFDVNTSCCFRFISMVTGSCQSTIKKVYGKILLSKEQAGKKERSLKSHLKPTRKLGKAWPGSINLTPPGSIKKSEQIMVIYNSTASPQVTAASAPNLPSSIKSSPEIPLTLTSTQPSSVPQPSISKMLPYPVQSVVSTSPSQSTHQLLPAAITSTLVMSSAQAQFIPSLSTSGSQVSPVRVPPLPATPQPIVTDSERFNSLSSSPSVLPVIILKEADLLAPAIKLTQRANELNQPSWSVSEESKMGSSSQQQQQQLQTSEAEQEDKEDIKEKIRQLCGKLDRQDLPSVQQILDDCQRNLGIQNQTRHASLSCVPVSTAAAAITLPTPSSLTVTSAIESIAVASSSSLSLLAAISSAVCKTSSGLFTVTSSAVQEHLISSRSARPLVHSQVPKPLLPDCSQQTGRTQPIGEISNSHIPTIQSPSSPGLNQQLSSAAGFAIGLPQLVECPQGTLPVVIINTIVPSTSAGTSSTTNNTVTTPPVSLISSKPIVGNKLPTLAVIPQTLPWSSQSPGVTANGSSQPIQLQIIPPVMMGPIEPHLPLQQPCSLSLTSPQPIITNCQKYSSAYHTQALQSTSSSTDCLQSPLTSCPAMQHMSQETLSSEEGGFKSTPTSTCDKGNNYIALSNNNNNSNFIQQGSQTLMCSDISSDSTRINHGSHKNAGLIVSRHIPQNLLQDNANRSSSVSSLEIDTKLLALSSSLRINTLRESGVTLQTNVAQNGCSTSGHGTDFLAQTSTVEQMSSVGQQLSTGTPSSCHLGSFVFDALAESPVKDSSLTVSPAIPAGGNGATLSTIAISSLNSTMLLRSPVCQSLNFQTYTTPSSWSSQPVTMVASTDQSSPQIKLTTATASPGLASQIKDNRLNRHKDPPQVGIVHPHVSGVKGSYGNKPTQSNSSSSGINASISTEDNFPNFGSLPSSGASTAPFNSETTLLSLTPGFLTLDQSSFLRTAPQMTDLTDSQSDQQQQVMLSLFMNPQPTLNISTQPTSNLCRQPVSQISLPSAVRNSEAGSMNSSAFVAGHIFQGQNMSTRNQANLCGNVMITSAPSLDNLLNASHLSEGQIVASFDNATLADSHASCQSSATSGLQSSTSGQIKLVQVNIASDTGGSASMPAFLPLNEQLILSLSPSSGLSSGVSSPNLSPQTLVNRSTNRHLNIALNTNLKNAVQNSRLQQLPGSDSSVVRATLSVTSPSSTGQAQILQGHVVSSIHQTGNSYLDGQSEGQKARNLSCQSPRTDSGVSTLQTTQKSVISTITAALEPGKMSSALSRSEQACGLHYSKTLLPVAASSELNVSQGRQAGHMSQTEGTDIKQQAPSNQPVGTSQHAETPDTTRNQILQIDPCGNLVLDEATLEQLLLKQRTLGGSNLFLPSVQSVIPGNLTENSKGGSIVKPNSNATLSTSVLLGPPTMILNPSANILSLGTPVQPTSVCPRPQQNNSETNINKPRPIRPLIKPTAEEFGQPLTGQKISVMLVPDEPGYPTYQLANVDPTTASNFLPEQISQMPVLKTQNEELMLSSRFVLQEQHSPTVSLTGQCEQPRPVDNAFLIPLLQTNQQKIMLAQNIHSNPLTTKCSQKTQVVMSELQLEGSMISSTNANVTTIPMSAEHNGNCFSLDLVRGQPPTVQSVSGQDEGKNPETKDIKDDPQQWHTIPLKGQELVLGDSHCQTNIVYTLTTAASSSSTLNSSAALMIHADMSKAEASALSINADSKSNMVGTFLHVHGKEVIDLTEDSPPATPQKNNVTTPLQVFSRKDQPAYFTAPVYEELHKPHSCSVIPEAGHSKTAVPGQETSHSVYTNQSLALLLDSQQHQSEEIIPDLKVRLQDPQVQIEGRHKDSAAFNYLSLDGISDEVRQMLIASIEAYGASNPDVQLVTQPFTASDTLSNQGQLSSGRSPQKVEYLLNELTQKAPCNNKRPDTVVTISTSPQFEQLETKSKNPRTSSISDSSASRTLPLNLPETRIVHVNNLPSVSLSFKNSTTPTFFMDGWARAEGVASSSTGQAQPAVRSGQPLPVVPALLGSNTIPAPPAMSSSVTKTVAITTATNPVGSRSLMQPLSSQDVQFIRTSNTPMDAVGPPNITIMSAYPSPGLRLRSDHTSGVGISGFFHQTTTSNTANIVTDVSQMIKSSSVSLPQSSAFVNPKTSQDVNPATVYLSFRKENSQTFQPLDNLPMETVSQVKKPEGTFSDGLGPSPKTQNFKLKSGESPCKPRGSKRSSIKQLLESKEQEKAAAAAAAAAAVAAADGRNSSEPVTFILSGTNGAPKFLLLETTEGQVGLHSQGVSNNVQLLGQANEGSACFSQTSSLGFTLIQPSNLPMIGTNKVTMPGQSKSEAPSLVANSPLVAPRQNVNVQSPSVTAASSSQLDLVAKLMPPNTRSSSEVCAGRTFLPPVVQVQSGVVQVSAVLSNQQTTSLSIHNSDVGEVIAPSEKALAKISQSHITSCEADHSLHPNSLLNKENESQIQPLGQSQVASRVVDQTDQLSTQSVPNENMGLGQAEKLKLRTSSDKISVTPGQYKEALIHKFQFSGDTQRDKSETSQVSQSFGTVKKLLMLKTSSPQLPLTGSRDASEQRQLSLKSPHLLQLMKSKEPVLPNACLSNPHPSSGQSLVQTEELAQQLKLKFSGQCSPALSQHEPLGKHSLAENGCQASQLPSSSQTMTKDIKAFTADAQASMNSPVLGQSIGGVRSRLPSQNPLLANILFANSGQSSIQPTSSNFSGQRTLSRTKQKVSAITEPQPVRSCMELGSAESSPLTMQDPKDESAALTENRKKKETISFGQVSEHFSKSQLPQHEHPAHRPPTYEVATQDRNANHQVYKIQLPPEYDSVTKLAMENSVKISDTTQSGRIVKVIDDIYKFSDEGDNPTLDGLKAFSTSRKSTLFSSGNQGQLGTFTEHLGKNDSNETNHNVPHSAAAAKVNRPSNVNLEMLVQNTVPCPSSFAAKSTSELWKSPKKTRTKKDVCKVSSKINLKKVQFSDVVTSKSAPEYEQSINVNAALGDTLPSDYAQSGFTASETFQHLASSSQHSCGNSPHTSSSRETSQAPSNRQSLDLHERSSVEKKDSKLKALLSTQAHIVPVDLDFKSKSKRKRKGNASSIHARLLESPSTGPYEDQSCEAIVNVSHHYGEYLGEVRNEKKNKVSLSKAYKADYSDRASVQSFGAAKTDTHLLSKPHSHPFNKVPAGQKSLDSARETDLTVSTNNLGTFPEKMEGLQKGSGMTVHLSQMIHSRDYESDKAPVSLSEDRSAQKDVVFDPPSSFNILSTQGYSILSRQRLRRSQQENSWSEGLTASQESTQFSSHSWGTGSEDRLEATPNDVEPFKILPAHLYMASPTENLSRQPSESPLFRHRVLESSFELARQMDHNGGHSFRGSRADEIEGRRLESPPKLFHSERRLDVLESMAPLREKEGHGAKDKEYIPVVMHKLSSPIFADHLEGRSSLEPTDDLISSLEILSSYNKEIQDAYTENRLLKREVAIAEYNLQQKQKELLLCDIPRGLLTDMEGYIPPSSTQNSESFAGDSGTYMPLRKRHASLTASTGILKRSPIPDGDLCRTEEEFTLRSRHPSLTPTAMRLILETESSFQESRLKGGGVEAAYSRAGSSSDDLSPQDFYLKGLRDPLVSSSTVGRSVSQLELAGAQTESVRHRYPSSELKPIPARGISNTEGFIPVPEPLRHRNLSSSLGMKPVLDIEPPSYESAYRQRNPSTSSLKSSYHDAEPLNFDANVRSRNPSSSSLVRFLECDYPILRSRNPSGSSNRRSRPGSSSSDREIAVNMDELPFFSDFARTRSRNSSGDSIEPSLDLMLDPQQLMQLYAAPCPRQNRH